MKSKKVLSLVVAMIMLLSVGLPVVNAEEVKASTEEEKWFCVQTGTFGVKQNAINQAIELYKLGFEDAFIYDYPENDMFYAIAGRFKTKEEAEPVLAEVKKHTKFSGSWIVVRTNMADSDITEARPLVPKEWHCVQIGVYSTKEEAMGYVAKLVKAGFKDAFMLFDGNTYNHWAMAGRFETEAEAEALKAEVGKKGFESFVTKRSFRDVDMFYPGDEGDLKSRVDEFEELVDKLPNPEDINQIKFEDKVGAEKARDLYNKMNDEERAEIGEGYVEKLEAVEAKIQSLKTEIKTKTRINHRQAQAWAVKRGAHKRFVDIAPVFWEYGERMGMRPEILYTQSGKETNFGKYTGAVKPEMNNWAGIKIADPIGDRTEDHETFETPEDGVRGHFNHMGIYCGVDPIGEPHPRWYKTSQAEWAGTILFVEDLGGLWAPNPDYGISIVRDYMVDLYNTPEPAEGVLEAALELSDRVEAVATVEEFGIYELSEIAEILAEYDNVFTDAHRAVIPYNIKEDIEKLRDKLDEKAVETIIDSIDKLPTLEKLTLEDKDIVDAIRIAYNALSEENKAKVTNLEKLEAAEKRIAELEKELEVPEDFEKVIDLIDKLPEPAKLELSHKAKVEEARTAYNALSEEDKAKVTNLKVLEAAEKRIAELEKEPEVPEDFEKVIDLIDKLPEPAKLELSHKAKVEEARAAYNALSEEDKTKVTNLKVLEAAEKRIAELEKDSDKKNGLKKDDTDKKKDPKKEDPKKLPKTGAGGNEVIFIGLVMIMLGATLFILTQRKMSKSTK